MLSQNIEAGDSLERSPFSRTCNANLLVGQSKRGPILKAAGLLDSNDGAFGMWMHRFGEHDIVGHIDEQLLRLEEETYNGKKAATEPESATTPSQCVELADYCLALSRRTRGIFVTLLGTQIVLSHWQASVVRLLLSRHASDCLDFIRADYIIKCNSIISKEAPQYYSKDKDNT
jgi:hypothetical protein